MKTAFLFNVKLSIPSRNIANQKDIEFDSPQVIAAIEATLKSLGHSVIKIEADTDAFEKLKQFKSQIDLVFNIAEGSGGDARESQVPLFCEILGIPYTHSTPTVHALRSDKHLTKALLSGAGIVRAPGGKNFPLLVKPNSEGSSKGIMDENVVKDKEELKERVKVLKESVGGEVLVEEYIEGREFTVGILGNYPARVLPIIEQKFDFLPEGMNKMASYELKWLYEDTLKNLHEAYDCPAKISPKLQKEIEDTSLKIYEFLQVRDCARIDYRLDKDNDLYFLEINTLPGLNPDETVISYFPLAARVAGLTFNDLIVAILASACKRWGIDEYQVTC